MKQLLIQISKTNKPMYMRLADGIRSAIRRGAIQPGESLPSSRSLAAQFKIHRHTVMSAVGELVAEGWIESEAKRRYRVTETLPSTFLKAEMSERSTILVEPQAVTFRRQVEDFTRPDEEGIKYQFPSGAPDLRLFPASELKSYLYDAITSKHNLGYSDPKGNGRLIRQISTYLRHVRNIVDRDLIVTNGSQESIFFLSQLFVKKGDLVAVEALGYPPAFAALRFAGAELLPIKIDAGGLDVEHLEKVLRTKKIRLLYLTPLHQYPTTVTLDAGRRLKLYELACRHGFHILEDDYDHEFHYENQPSAPMASFDPAQLILYVSTFSKILYPSSRIGFMAVPRKVAEQVAKLKRITSRQNESILQDAVARWMEAGGFERHLRRMRRVYELRRNAVVSTLEALQSAHPKLQWHVPEGGMALWLDTGVDSHVLAKRGLSRGVSVVPESWYRLDGETRTHLRLGFSSQTPEENARGLKLLFQKS